MITLALDASTYIGTVAVIRDGEIAAQGEAAMRGRDVERLMPAIVRALSDARVPIRDVSRVVCGDGPGSFTSLRIAASIAKGIAMGNGVPVLHVSSLALIPAGVDDLEPGGYVAVLDALRGEGYFQRLRRTASGDLIAESQFYLGPVATVVQVARDLGVRIIGPVDVLDLLPDAARQGPMAAIVASPRARGVTRAEGLLEPAELAGWEPRYGRLAEAQVKWEAQHGRPLPAQ